MLLANLICLSQTSPMRLAKSGFLFYTIQSGIWLSINLWILSWLISSIDFSSSLSAPTKLLLLLYQIVLILPRLAIKHLRASLNESVSILCMVSMKTAQLTKPVVIHSTSKCLNVSLCGMNQTCPPHNNSMEVFLVICHLVSLPWNVPRLFLLDICMWHTLTWALWPLSFLASSNTRTPRFNKCDVSPTMSCPFMTPSYIYLYCIPYLW